MGNRGRAAKHAGKTLERAVAKLLHTARYPADVGGSVDVENHEFVCQCKHVGSMSLATLTALVEMAAKDGATRSKRGIVAVKRRPGKGGETPILIVLKATDFEELIYGKRSEPEGEVGGRPSLDEAV